jgi:hypothetical protein
MTIDPSSGLIRWIPSAIGSFPVRVEVSDGKGGRRAQSFVIMVEDIFEHETPPVANAGPDQTVFVTQTVTLDGSKSSVGRRLGVKPK